MKNRLYALIGNWCFWLIVGGIGPAAAQAEACRTAVPGPRSAEAGDSVRFGAGADTLGRKLAGQGAAVRRVSAEEGRGGAVEEYGPEKADKPAEPDKPDSPDKPDKEEIRLNEIFRKAIESGCFLPAEPGSLSLPRDAGAEGGFSLPAGYANSGNRPAGTLNGASGLLPLAVDFSDYLGPDPFLTDTLRRLADSARLTPQLFMLQYFKPRLAPAVRQEAYTPTRRPDGDKGVRLGKLPVYVKVSAGNLFLEEVRDGQRRGSIHATFTFCLSVEDLLERICWKSARNKARNRKRENTWKYYNDMP